MMIWKHKTRYFYFIKTLKKFNIPSEKLNIIIKPNKKDITKRWVEYQAIQNELILFFFSCPENPSILNPIPFDIFKFEEE